MERDHHGALLAIVDARRPHIQRQTVFTHAAHVQVPLDEHRVIAVQTSQRLRADWAVPETFADARPGRWLFGRHIAVLAPGRRAIGNSLELLDAAVRDPLHFAGSRLDRPE